MQKYVALTPLSIVGSLTFVAFSAVGCGTGNITPSTAAPDTAPGAVLHGTVHGGRAPISGAHVYLFAANTTGYGGNGIAASSSNASISLLNSNTGNVDSNGNYYVVSNSSGDWTISSDYSCTPGQQVYVYSQGGNAGSGTNNGIGLMAALGACPVATNFATAYPFITANEVTTVAAAYALAGFATDSTHISSSGTSLALTGIANAFAGAANLANISGGTSRTSPLGSNGTVPQTMIDTLANILAACVNSEDVAEGNPTTYSANCTTLFNDETYNSIATTDTATAAIRIAQNPSTGITSLYGLSSGSPVFLPKLTSQPTNFFVLIDYTSGGGLDSAWGIAIDASGNIWMSDYEGTGGITEFTPTGVPVSGSPFTGTGSSSYPTSIAIDPSGNVWMPGFLNNKIAIVNSSGTAISGSPFTLSTAGIDEPYFIAFDTTGNAWISNYAGYKLTKLSLSGTTLSGTGYALGSNSSTKGVAVDASNNVWVGGYSCNCLFEFNSGTANANSPYTTSTLTTLSSPDVITVDSSNNLWVGGNSTSAVTKVSNSGTLLSGSTGFTSGGIDGPQAIAIDGSGNAWITNEVTSVFTELSPSGTALTPSSGVLLYGSNSQPEGVAVDGSGNVWITIPGYSSLGELVGAATPVVTPLIANLISPYTHPASKP